MLWLIFIGCSILSGLSGAPAEPDNPTEIVVEVPKGATARGMGTPLQQAGALDDGEAFSWYVRIHKEGACIKAGKHRVHRAMTHGEIIDALCGVPLSNAVAFTVIEGWRIREIDAALAKSGYIQPGEYKALARTPRAFKASCLLYTSPSPRD